MRARFTYVPFVLSSSETEVLEERRSARPERRAAARDAGWARGAAGHDALLTRAACALPRRAVGVRRASEARLTRQAVGAAAVDVGLGAVLRLTGAGSAHLAEISSAGRRAEPITAVRVDPARFEAGALLRARAAAGGGRLVPVRHPVGARG